MTYGITNPNGLKTIATQRLGTPELTWIYFTAVGPGIFNAEDEYDDANSNFSRAIASIALYCDIYAIDRPDETTFGVQVRADSVPLAEGEYLGSDDDVSILNALIYDAVGFGVTSLTTIEPSLTPPINLDYPIPGSGDYRSGATALSGITYANIGTPYAPTGDITTVTNSVGGLYRSKYDGNFCAAPLNTVGAYDLNWFVGKTPMKSVADTSLSWGDQSDGDNAGENHFSIEWKGYINVPTTQNYNMYIESDDTTAVWIGSSAVSGFNAGNCIVSSSNKGLPGQASSSRSANSMTLDSTKWYPIRIWFSEFGGGCKCQIYLQGADGTTLNGAALNLAYNSATGGFNP